MTSLAAMIDSCSDGCLSAVAAIVSATDCLMQTLQATGRHALTAPTVAAMISQPVSQCCA